MGSIWDLGLKKDDDSGAKKGQAPPGKVDLRLYGLICIVLAVILAAVFVLILATGQIGEIGRAHV